MHTIYSTIIKILALYIDINAVEILISWHDVEEVIKNRINR